MLERYLIEHCSPTLASVKTANLFTWSFAPEEMPEQQVRYWNQELQARGISLVVLRVQNQKALMYVCRKQRLQERLDDQEVQNFLGKYGYVQKDADYALQRLKERLAKAEGFPHEIGVFLDYPLEDVVMTGNQPALVALFSVPRLDAWPRMMLVMQATMDVAT